MKSPFDNPAIVRGFSNDGRVYVRPILAAAAGPQPRLTFEYCEIMVRDRGGIATATGSRAALADWADREGGPLGHATASWLERLQTPPPPAAGFAFDRLLVMGVLNVTPDSFSDGGRYLSPVAAIAHGRALAEAGADIVDIGGESTRPGASPVAADVELARVAPVIEGLSGLAALSIDSRHAAVVERAVVLGAGLINDVSALTSDPASMATAAAAGVPVILMHAQGDPRTMQNDPTYEHPALDVYDFLEARTAACEAAGMPRARLIADPGIGFGKTRDHNIEILHRLSVFHGLGCPLAVGLSRKRLIANLSAGEPVEHRLPGSLASALWAILQGVHIVRVHDVTETCQAVAVWQALSRGAWHGDSHARGSGGA